MFIYVLTDVIAKLQIYNEFTKRIISLELKIIIIYAFPYNKVFINITSKVQIL